MLYLKASLLASLTAGLATRQATSPAPVSQTTCNGKTYVYQQLAGFGQIPGDARDRFGDTIGGIGSGIAIPRASWQKLPDGSYKGLLWAQPDRGWNTEGTINYQGRVHQYTITLRPNNSATVADPSPPNINFQYLNTVLFTDPTFLPTTSLDADATGYKFIPGFPDLPNAIYSGDGFGGRGFGGNRVTLDPEGIVVNNDGTFWISDEYGPYIYRFGPTGNMIQAIRPPPVYIPMRNGSESFSSDNPPIYTNEDDDVVPADVDSGRVNNHGFEGLTASPDGKNLYVLVQEALHQDGGEKKSTRFYTRFLHYAISGLQHTLVAEYVVKLPVYPSGPKPDTAGQSEMHYISPTQFLILARDSNRGAGQDDTLSVYRHADVFDISDATNIMGDTYDCATCSIAPGGVLKPGIVPATYCPFLDYNNNAQLRRFGVHNGGAQDSTLLNEKWESFATVPVNGDGSDGDFFLFSMSDNDFITQNGYYNFGRDKYSDASGFSLNNQMLAFQISLPKGATPA